MKRKNDIDENKRVIYLHQSWVTDKAYIVNFQFELLIGKVLLASEETRQNFIRNHSDSRRRAF